MTARGRRRPKLTAGFWAAVALALLLGAYAAVFALARPHVDGDRLRFDTFLTYVDEDRIRDATILDEDAYVVGQYVAPDGRTARYNTPLLKGTQGHIVDTLVVNRIPATVDQQVGKRLLNLASTLLPTLILVVLIGYLILSYRKGTGLFSVRGGGARRVSAEDVPVTFADVAGQDAAVLELREVEDFLAHPERFRAMGATAPKGILLYGPPGSGKTLLARALAGESGAGFYSVSGSDFVEVYLGIGAARVRELFREAREHAPAVIFIDELDSIGRARGVTGMTASHGEQEQALNQILAEMDGFSPSDGILVVGATNRPDVLDAALLRPGRFDRSIGLERPDEAARLAVLQLHGRGKPMEADVELVAIARRAIGLTGADLASVVNEAAILAVRAGKPAISQPELAEALQRILQAPDRQRRLSLRSRTVGRRYASDERATFGDVAGVDDAIAELADVTEYLAYPDRFSRLGARSPRGILLSGPPGCGKTLLARAVAGEANAAFFSVAGSELGEVFVGEGAARVRDLFAEARALAPAIIFFDEIDAVGGQRGASVAGGDRDRDQTLNQILVEMDGFERDAAVVVMGATNRPDILDPALVRPGRFDRHVQVALPDRAGRRAILALHARDKPLAAVDLDVLAAQTLGFSGADLANVLNEAALLAARRGLPAITDDLLDEGVDRAVLGVGSRRVVLSAAHARVVAYHEAGHALVSRALPGARPPHRLSIVPRGGAFGHCIVLDGTDEPMLQRSAMIDQMAAFLAGRAAEDIVFGDPGAGSAADVARVSHIARQMVEELAMGETLGPQAYGRNSSGRISEETARRVDAEVTRLVDDADARARAVLVAERPALDRVAEALIARERLSSAELDELLRRPARPGVAGARRDTG